MYNSIAQHLSGAYFCSRGYFMVRRLFLAVAFFLSLAFPAFSASLFLSPVTQTTDEACVVYVSAGDLVSATGLDLVITWNENVVDCDSVLYHGARLPGFTNFLIDIDNGTGRIEAVLLRLDPGGYSGDADSFLEIRFVPDEPGTTSLAISNTNVTGDPFLIDVSNTGIDAERSTAEITVTDMPPVVTATTLYQNHPNPFNPGTTIRFDLANSSAVNLRIFDVGGRLVRTLVEGRTYGVGEWTIEWDSSNNSGNTVPSGIYFCVFEAAGITESRKLVVVR